MKKIIFSNWHFMRWLRLGLALFLMAQSISLHEWFFLIFALFFLFQALFNLGCNTTSCAIPTSNRKEHEQ
jgi:hypothetical protein